MSNLSNRLPVKNIATWIFLTFLALVVLYPMFWVVMGSLKTNQSFLTSPLSLPNQLHFNNWARAWEQGLSNYFLNSVIVTSVSVFLTATIGAFAAYGLARFDFKGKRIAFYAILAGLLISPQAALLPLYRLLENLGLYNTYWALILPYIGFRLPFAVLLMRGYFMSLPSELEESAYMDGCGPFTAFLRVILPISMPIVAATCIVTSRLVWNEFLFALIFLNDTTKYTIPVGLSKFRNALTTDYTATLAGITIAALPMIILFLVLQKQFIRGLTAGSVKG